MLNALRKPGFGLRNSAMHNKTSSKSRLDAQGRAHRFSNSRFPIPDSRAPGLRATSSFHKSRGFSLIELVAVMVLIALVFAMVSLSFSKSLSSAKVQAASRNLVAALRYTRGQAIVRGKSASLELDVENNRYMAPGRQIVNLPSNMRMNLLTADNEVTGRNSGRIRFFPDG